MTVSIFTAATLGNLPLKNRVVMAPMTRSRAPGNVPSALMATYYAQRADVGLIVTEGTSPSKNGLGYPSIPGAYSSEQAAGWRRVADAVHEKGSRLFVQLMHTGRIGHPANLPDGGELVAPSAIAAAGSIHTPTGMQPHTTPRALREDELPAVIAEYVHAAKILVAAGVDGVELHAANGYLLEQFLHPSANHRTDGYGGSVDRRQRFVVECAQAVADAVGGDKVGIRLSPHGTNGDLATYDGVDEATVALVKKLAATGIGYVHIVDHSSMGAPAVPASLKAAIRAAWPRTLILAGGYTKDSANADLVEGKADLIAFGRPVLANPNFVARLAEGRELAAVDFSTLYTPGDKGYTDYPL